MVDPVHDTYVLLGTRDRRVHTGCTDGLQKRVLEHDAGRVRSTAHRVPLELISCEAGPNRDDAMRREHLLKASQGKRFLRNRRASFREGRDKLERRWDRPPGRPGRGFSGTDLRSCSTVADRVGRRVAR